MTKSETTKKVFIIPTKVRIPLVCAPTSTSQHFLFSTAVASLAWDSRLRGKDGVGQFEDLKMRQFEDNFFAEKRTVQQKNSSTIQQRNSSTATKTTLRTLQTLQTLQTLN